MTITNNSSPDAICWSFLNPSRYLMVPCILFIHQFLRVLLPRVFDPFIIYNHFPWCSFNTVIITGHQTCSSKLSHRNLHLFTWLTHPTATFITKWLNNVKITAVWTTTTYLFGHLPDAVNELEEDRWPVSIRMLVFSMTNSLHQPTQHCTSNTHSNNRSL